MEDLADLNPGLKRGFEQLLEWEGDDIAEVFGWDFAVRYECTFRCLVRLHTVPGGTAW